MTLRKTLILSCLLTAAGMQAQEKIVTVYGDTINAYYPEVLSNSVSFTLKDDETSPILEIDKDNISFIKLKKGTELSVPDYKSMTDTTGLIDRRVADYNILPVEQYLLSKAARLENQKIIDKLNSDPIISYRKKKTPKSKAGYVYAIFGAKKKSVFTDENIEIQFISGYVSDTYKYTDTGLITGEEKFTSNTIQNPSVIFKIRNKTDKTLYIDLGNSYFNHMGEPEFYYKPPYNSTSSSTSPAVRAEPGAVVGALENGGLAGYIDGRANDDRSSTDETESAEYSKRFIAVAPNSVVETARRELLPTSCPKGVYVSSGRFQFSLSPDDVKLKNGQILTYREETSPMNYSFVISYSETEDCKDLRTLRLDLYLKNLVGQSIPFNMLTGEYTRQVYLDDEITPIWFEGELNNQSTVNTLPAK